jgi:general L-amino acid transport system substrate-binding protein
MKKTIMAAAALLLTAGGAGAGPTLDAVKARGQVHCGVNQGVAGFSIPDARGVWTGIDVEYCRAVAAALFGDAGKVRFTAVTAAQRFVALQSGEIDILARNSTITLQRDAQLGLNFVGFNFFDGQGFLVRRSANVDSAKKLDGATICVAQGTTHELNLTDFARANRISYRPVVIESQEQLYAAFFGGGRCDALTQDASALAAAQATVSGNPAAYLLLPDRISKEPLGPFVRQGDDQMFDIAKWVLYAMIEAEEAGLTRENVDRMRAESQDPNVRRILGVTRGNGAALGLDENWAYNVIKQVGNYGEVFHRLVGKGSPLGLERGLNDLWNRGGLMYAPPMR